MDNNFISAPNHFQHMEGNSVDFAKTFDLNGTDNDEMLRLYLRKAGLSDQIECLAPEQRRAFIYDIIKSNKLPGYWMPSTMKTTPFMQSSPQVRPPPPPMRMETTSTMIETSSGLNYATMSTSSSSNSLKSMGTNSPIMPHRFVQPMKTPPSPTTFVTGKKGAKYEISGPVNFLHVSGDMTRDMTRNAFDLSLTMNDNVLKKYLIERGIKDEDISGMRKQDLIKNIVQSKYTWVPTKSNRTIKQEVRGVDTTIESKPLAANQSIPSPVPSLKSLESTDPFSNYALVNGRFSESSTAASTPSPIQKRHPFSNFATLSSRFADSSQFPSPNSLYDYSHEPDLAIAPLPSLPPQAIRPAPPPRSSKSTIKNVQTAPPPPSTIKATINNSPDVYHCIGVENKESALQQSLVPIKTSPPPPPPPPMQMSSTLTGAPTPPPPPPKQMRKSTTEAQLGNNIAYEGDTRNALLDSIRKGTTLKAPKNSKKRNLPATPLLPNQKSKTVSRAPPPPNQTSNTVSGASSLPPPPSIQMPKTVSGVPPPPPPPPPPMQMTNASTGAPISIPPPMDHSISKNITPALSKNSANEGDSRDALLEGIRKGIVLKKVDQKAATISGVKPRAERKPPVTDFLSELKLGITLRRVKNPTDNPFADNDLDESNA